MIFKENIINPRKRSHSFDTYYGPL